MSTTEMTDFDESDAPYSDPSVFTELWNKMDPARRRNNTGLFLKAFNRPPTELEIEHGISTDVSAIPAAAGITH